MLTRGHKPLKINDHRGVADEDAQGITPTPDQSRVQFPHRYAQKFRRPSLAEAKGYDMTRNY